MLPTSDFGKAHGYFTIGSTKDEVLAAQGTPDSFGEDYFRYGYSTVYFKNGRVTSWENSALKELKVRMRQSSDTER